jgi:protein involved in polysaccharide export with SLBB domain
MLRPRPQDRTETAPDQRGNRLKQKKKDRSTRWPWQVFSVLGVLLALLATGCQNYTGETLPETATGQHPGVLTTGNVIRISFTTAPELNQSEKIESDGRISLSLIGQVYASGKSTSQLQEELTNMYKSQLQNSEVTVTLESVTIPVVVSGRSTKTW